MKSVKSKLSFILLFIMVFSLYGCGIDSFKHSSEQNDGLKVSELRSDLINSVTLKKEMKLNVYLPKGYSNRNKYPVLYMIHGFAQNGADTWMPDLKLNKKADELIESKKIRPLIIVAPQIDNSWGVNSAPVTSELGTPPNQFNKGRYEDYLLKELVPYIDSKYSTDAKREHRYIGGLSMGGFIALRTAFLHTDLFSKAGGHSAGIILDDTPNTSNLSNFLFPNDGLREDRDPVFIAKKKDLSNLKVYLDCGDKDQFKFYKGCELLHKIMIERKVESEYHLNAGMHDAAYWEANEDKYLIFYAGY